MACQWASLPVSSRFNSTTSRIHINRQQVEPLVSPVEAAELLCDYQKILPKNADVARSWNPN